MSRQYHGKKVHACLSWKGVRRGQKSPVFAVWTRTGKTPMGWAGGKRARDGRRDVLGSCLDLVFKKCIPVLMLFVWHMETHCFPQPWEQRQGSSEQLCSHRLTVVRTPETLCSGEPFRSTSKAVWLGRAQLLVSPESAFCPQWFSLISFLLIRT